MVRLFRNTIETEMTNIERGKRERERQGQRETERLRERFHCC